jgi:hypothetical protein
LHREKSSQKNCATLKKLPKIKQPPNRRENTPNLVTLFAIETQCAFDPSIEIFFIQTASKKFLPINQPTPHRQHTVARHKTSLTQSCFKEF